MVNFIGVVYSPFCFKVKLGIIPFSYFFKLLGKEVGWLFKNFLINSLYYFWWGIIPEEDLLLP